MAFETYDPEMIRDLHKHIEIVDGKPKLPDMFCGEWEDTRATLIELKKITPDPVDKLIDEIVEAGDRACKSIQT